MWYYKKHTLKWPSSSLTIVIFRWPIVGFINSCSEALVAASPPDHILARTVEWEEFVFSADLWHGRLETLQRTGLLQAESRAEFYWGWWSWGGQNNRQIRATCDTFLSACLFCWTTGDLVWCGNGTLVQSSNKNLHLLAIFYGKIQFFWIIVSL